MHEPFLSATGIEKSFGATRVLDGVDLSIPPGTILALLGPNGAGKTTMVHILSTLLEPDAGHATIAGYDVVREPARVREVISLTGQHAAVDEFLTGAENLQMMARLAHLDAGEVRSRTAELLEEFDLADVASRKVATYSGGMRRRLDLAASLISRPPLLFLDEPTTGLDPRSRLTLWDVVRGLAAGGVTILLTTQYLEEADQLADDIAVIDGGRIIAQGTADELKRGLAGERVELCFGDPATYARAAEIIGREGADGAAATNADEPGEVAVDAERLTISVGSTRTAATAKHLFDLLDRHGLDVDTIAIVRPSLDDVFLALTGRAASEVATDGPNGTNGPNGSSGASGTTAEVAA